MNTPPHNAPSPGQELLDAVKAGFVLQGKTMAGWCKENAICRINARTALLGNRNGPKAIALRKQIIEASSATSLLNRGSV